jgi:hypothetical protein
MVSPPKVPTRSGAAHRPMNAYAHFEGRHDAVTDFPANCDIVGNLEPRRRSNACRDRYGGLAERAFANESHAVPRRRARRRQTPLERGLSVR